MLSTTPSHRYLDTGAVLCPAFLSIWPFLRSDLLAQLSPVYSQSFLSCLLPFRQIYPTSVLRVTIESPDDATLVGINDSPVGLLLMIERKKGTGSRDSHDRLYHEVMLKLPDLHLLQ
jgi:hypothetical protein